MSSKPTAATPGGFEAITPGTLQKLAMSGSSAQSAAFAATTTLVEVVATEDAYIQFGANPTATANSQFLPANTIARYGVTPGQKVAVLQAATGGNLHITEAF